MPADSTHVVHALGVLSLLGGLSTVDGSTLASPHAILIQGICKCPLDGVKTKVPDDAPDPGCNDIVPASQAFNLRVKTTHKCVPEAKS